MQRTLLARSPRQSNFELLRIVAMLMVLSVHANYISFGFLTANEIHANPVGSFGRAFAEAATLAGVNIFVMISGWFGIKASLKGFCNFVFQVLYFFALSLLVTCLLGLNQLSLVNVAYLFCLPNRGWFIICYMTLYVLSPLMNSFLDSAPKRVQLQLLCAFFALQTLYGFIGNSTNYSFGYTTLSFIGLYLLSGFLRRYGQRLFECQRWRWGGGNVLCVSSLYKCDFALCVSAAGGTLYGLH